MAYNIVSQPELLGAIDRILQKRSIAKRVSDIQPIKSPQGLVVGTEYDNTNDKVNNQSNYVDAVTRTIKSEFSIESIQELQDTYGEKFNEFLAYYLIDDLTYKIDKDFLDMVKARASLVKEISYDGGVLEVARSILVLINKALSDLPKSDNRSSGAWAVVSSDIGSILSVGLLYNAKENPDDDSPSYIGNLSGIDIYVDYTHDNSKVDNVVMGIKGNGYSRGSTIFSPYTSAWVETNDADTGEPLFFLIDRTGMTINPIDNQYYDDGNGTSAFLAKFNIDVSGMVEFS